MATLLSIPTVSSDSSPAENASASAGSLRAATPARSSLSVVYRSNPRFAITQSAQLRTPARRHSPPSANAHTSCSAIRAESACIRTASSRISHDGDKLVGAE